MKRVILTPVALTLAVLALYTMESRSTQFFFDDIAPRPASLDGSEFVFARLVYGQGLAGFGGFGRRGPWATDWPEADAHFMLGIDRLSNIRVLLDQYITVPIMDDALFDYPFMYAVEVGRMELTQPEADRLREYLLRGGFLVVDDFWGTYQWQSFYRQLKKIFPEKEAEQIPMSHPIFHSFYDIDEIIQVPVVSSGCNGRPTWEQDGYVPYALAIFDDDRRPMIVINLNTDLGDAWEHADQPCYPNEFSSFAYRMGINFIIYSMTH